MNNEDLETAVVLTEMVENNPIRNYLIAQCVYQNYQFVTSQYLRPQHPVRCRILIQFS